MLRSEVENKQNIVSWSSIVKDLLQHSGFTESVDIKKLYLVFIKQELLSIGLFTFH